MQDQPQLFQLLDDLVGRWCDRRDLAALRPADRDVETALRLVERMLRDAGQLP